jgi:hypothetical protein
MPCAPFTPRRDCSTQHLTFTSSRCSYLHQHRQHHQPSPRSQDDFEPDQGKQGLRRARRLTLLRPLKCSRARVKVRSMAAAAAAAAAALNSNSSKDIQRHCILQQHQPAILRSDH